jgi:hypothetical protein
LVTHFVAIGFSYTKHALNFYAYMPWTFIWFADEWANFLERIGRGESSEEDFKESSSDTLELRFWVSYRGQTLARTGQFVALFLLPATECSYFSRIYVQ